MKEIQVLLTMDVEPTIGTTHPKATGPIDWAMGERAVMGYFNMAQSYGVPITCFVHPETAVAQAGMFRGIEDKGACLGLHMHPWKYSMWRHESKRFYEDYGGLSEPEQCSLLSEASGVWRDAIGHRPFYFRPGAFSANDALYRLLAAEGFLGGSCSMPGRVWPDVRAIWAGAEPDPHRTSAHCRQIRGNLELINVPVSVDFSVVLKDEKKRREMHPDLRPDTDWPLKYGISYQTIASNILNQIKARAPANPVIVIITHNHFEFSDIKDPVTQRLKTSLDAIFSAASAAGFTPVGATLADVVNRMLRAPATPEVFTCPEAR